MDNTFSYTFGKLTSAQDNTIINKIYSYVLMVLSGLSIGKDENENEITDRFCKKLNITRPYELPLYFHHQNLENSKDGTSTDFAVFETRPYADMSASSKSLVKFEAKRLTPKLGKNREKEYVVGEYNDGVCIKNSGGIERFKNGRHGKDVEYGGIIGYIQYETPDYWIEKVNGWIEEQIIKSSDKDLLWEKEDLLIDEPAYGTVSCYSSISCRLSDKEIKFKHFWIEAR